MQRFTPIRIASSSFASPVRTPPGVRLFGSSAWRRQQEERKQDVDPTPNKARGGSEQSMPTSGSGDEIADSQGAYDGSTPRPDQSGRQMEGEKPVNMSQSAANVDASESAMARRGKRAHDEKPASSGDPWKGKE